MSGEGNAGSAGDIGNSDAAWEASQGDDFASRMARQSLVAVRSQTSTRDRYSRMDEGSKS